jgi:hypothetical protein
MIQIEKKLEELETKARELITEIVPLMRKVPKTALGDVKEFINDALQIAKTNLDISKKETERMVRRHSWVSRMFVFLFIAVLFGGCGYVKPTENQRQAHQQTIGAGDFVEKNASDPLVKQAGSDVKATATILQDTLIGKPAVIKDYSHDEAVKIVTVVKKEYDEAQAPWYKRWAGTLIGGLSVLATGLGIVGFFYPPAGLIANILKPIAGALTSMKQQADAHPNDVLPLDTLQTGITALTKDPKIGPILNDLLAKAHLDQIVHSPEAPDLPPAAPSTPAAPAA